MNKKTKVLIFGITGQDGSYLAEFLLEKGYNVHGFIRRSATGNKKNIMHIMDEIKLHRGDLADSTSLYRTIRKIRPDVIYNEADQDHVSWSFDGVDYSLDITGTAVGRLLEITRQIDPEIKFFQPVSSTMFGQPTQVPQTEDTPFKPRSPYGAAKVLAYVLARYYRDVFDMYVSTGIFYNHESPRRNTEYVTRKITRAAARISKGLQKKLYLGNLDAKIDFGYSREYMEIAWKIMQLDEPDDFIICTGDVHSVREFLDETFKQVGLNPDDYVEFDSCLLRPGDVQMLVGDTSKLQKAIGCIPQVKFKELISIMLEHDLADAEKDQSADVAKTYTS